MGAQTTTSRHGTSLYSRRLLGRIWGIWCDLLRAVCGMRRSTIARLPTGAMGVYTLWQCVLRSTTSDERRCGCATIAPHQLWLTTFRSEMLFLCAGHCR